MREALLYLLPCVYAFLALSLIHILAPEDGRIRDNVAFLAG